MNVNSLPSDRAACDRPIGDPIACYQAIQARDARFDGRFFTAVLTTKIYCRPICPARCPAPQNCRFYPSAAAAQAAGFRPCLRCRPELAPGFWPGLSTSALVGRALRRINAGALDEGSVSDLAARLGIGDRHLRRLFLQHLGATPVKVAQTRRLLFAKQLLSETTLPISEVALAAGFGSLRRFNALIQAVYARSPRDLRRQSGETPIAAAPLTLRLPFVPPYDWDALIRFFQARAIPGVEDVTPEYYRRTIAMGDHQGSFEVRSGPEKSYLQVTIDFPDVTYLDAIVERLRQMFDLNANGAEIARHLIGDERLRSGLQSADHSTLDRLAGLRLPGAWDPFEVAVRAILGQQISVAAARTLASRLVATYGLALPGALGESETIGPHALRYIFPTPAMLATADLTSLGVTAPRAAAIARLAATLVEQPQFFQQFASLEDAVAQLCALPGIGPWTAHYMAMRALGEPDAFPAADLVLLKGMSGTGERLKPPALSAMAESWRPWRAYAAIYIWTILG
jgi:AraC family transcriptional regulator, regulatory protein of adaptative response / DNA-3-methyladenine glycosylase II